MNANNITIPQACHQPWQQMTEASNGRHCEQCSKIVIDFTKMTNDEIIGYLSTSQNICGRINQRQLTNLNQQNNVDPAPVSGRWKKWVMAAGLFASTIFFRTSAQVKSTVSQTDSQGSTCWPDGRMLGKIAAYRIISGRITDEKNIGLPGASIKAGELTAVTDTNGNFQLKLPYSTRQFIVNRIGYANRTVAIDATTDYNIKLTDAKVLMGEVVVVPRDLKIKHVKQN